MQALQRTVEQLYDERKTTESLILSLTEQVSALSRRSAQSPRAFSPAVSPVPRTFQPPAPTSRFGGPGECSSLFFRCRTQTTLWGCRKGNVHLMLYKFRILGSFCW